MQECFFGVFLQSNRENELHSKLAALHLEKYNFPVEMIICLPNGTVVRSGASARLCPQNLLSAGSFTDPEASVCSPSHSLPPPDFVGPQSLTVLCSQGCCGSQQLYREIKQMSSYWGAEQQQ